MNRLGIAIKAVTLITGVSLISAAGVLPVYNPWLTLGMAVSGVFIAFLTPLIANAPAMPDPNERIPRMSPEIAASLVTYGKFNISSTVLRDVLAGTRTDVQAGEIREFYERQRKAFDVKISAMKIQDNQAQVTA